MKYYNCAYEHSLVGEDELAKDEHGGLIRPLIHNMPCPHHLDGTLILTSQDCDDGTIHSLPGLPFRIVRDEEVILKQEHSLSEAGYKALLEQLNKSRQ